MAQLADTAFNLASNVPLPPQARLALAATDPDTQQALRKGVNTGFTILLAVLATISTITAIALLATAESPRLNDGRWWGGWAVLALAAIPLTVMAIWIGAKTSSCAGSVVDAARQFGRLRGFARRT